MSYEEIIELVKKSIRKTSAKTAKEHMAVEFNIAGEGEGAFYVEISEGTCAVEPYEYYDRDAKVKTGGEELKKLVKGEKSLEESIAEGSTSVEGSMDAAIRLLNLTKPLAKKTTKKATKAEKDIVEMTKKSKNSKVAKDITNGDIKKVRSAKRR